MKDEKVKIFCRFRPSLGTDENHVTSASGASLYLTDIQENAFEKVFRADASQEQVYNDVAKAAVTGILSFICETTSRNYDGGKTYTLQGIQGSPDEIGLIPRIGHDIFEHIYSLDENMEFEIKCSYVDITSDKAYDLLNVNNLKVGMTESRHGMVDLRNVTAVFVTLPEEIAELLEEGNSNRRGDAGRCCKSSIFVIDLHQKDRLRRRKLHAELIFIEMNFSSSSVPYRCVTFDDMVNDEQRLMCRACSLQKQRIGHYVGRKPKWPSVNCCPKFSKMPYIASLLKSIKTSRTIIIICCSTAAVNDHRIYLNFDYAEGVVRGQTKGRKCSKAVCSLSCCLLM